MCAFCSIVAGDSQAHAVFEDETFLAFLDIRPLFPGHTLLIPKEHFATLPDLPPPLIGPLFTVARTLSEAIPGAMGATGSFVAINNVVSQSVPHLHVHVVPRRPKDGLRGFFWPRTTYKGEREMTEVMARIRAALGNEG